MTSPAQIAANRRNAARSTGPKTPAGKAAAARNALRHGLTAAQIVLFDEEAADFAGFHDGLRAAFAPEDAVEEDLVERMALCAWRLRRAARAEAALLNRAVDVFRRPDEAHELGQAYGRAIDDLTTLSRHEAALDRAFRRAGIQLERRQASRRGEAVPPPITVEVEGLDALEAPEKIKICKTKPISAPAPHLDPLPACGERECPASAGG